MSGKRPTRTRLATGIYADKYGIAVVVRGREHRFPLGTPLLELKSTRLLIQGRAGASPGQRGTLTADIAAYLKTIPDTRRRREATTLLQHWIDAFGSRATLSLTALDVRQQLAAWHERFSKKHLNNLRQGLAAVLRAHGHPNVVKDVKPQRVRYDEPRGMPYPVIERILGSMPARGRPTKGEKIPAVNLAQLRLRVMAYTGLSPAELKRLLPRDVNLKAKTIFVRPRLKGEGVDPSTQPLTDKGAEALAALVAANGLGGFSTRSLAYCWRRAVTRTKAAWDATKDGPWPIADDARAYDLRHSFGSLILAAKGDLEATARLLRHRTLHTTRRYAQAAAAERERLAVEAVNQALGASMSLPSPASEMSKKARKWLP